LSSRLRKKWERRRLSWLQVSRSSEIWDRPWQRRRKCILVKRKIMTLSFLAWSKKRKQLSKKWDRTSQSTKNQNLNTIRIMSSLISLRHSREESRESRPTSPNLRPSCYLNTRPSKITSRWSWTSRRKSWRFSESTREISRITLRTSADKWDSTRTCVLCWMPSRGPLLRVETVSWVTRILKQEDSIDLWLETEIVGDWLCMDDDPPKCQPNQHSALLPSSERQVHTINKTIVIKIWDVTRLSCLYKGSNQD